MLDANNKTYHRYQNKLDKAREAFDEKFRRLARSLNVCIRTRNKVVYLEDMIARVLEADAVGQRFNERRPPKAKPGRKIQL